jgi:general stress protein 26
MTHDKDLKALYEKIEDLETAMMTTRRRDGHLVSRAMANQKRAAGADLWFVTSSDTDKLDDLENDPHVNLAYYKDRTREWVSVAGLGKVSRDIETIRQLWAPDWTAWFAKGDDPRAGTPEDPRIVLVGVDVHSAVYLEQNQPQPVILFELVKGWLTGDAPELGEMHRVET